MNGIDKIESSPVRPVIDKYLTEGLDSKVIVARIADEQSVIFTVDEIKEYAKKFRVSSTMVVNQVVNTLQDISKRDMPPMSEMDRLASNFSFTRTNDDLDLIYDRIRQLRTLAEANPDERSYDVRIKDYLAQAESIRTRVFRHQYEHIRKAVLMTVGKKICAAAISVLMPYIHKELRAEALKRFQSSVEPLLDMDAVPAMPDDIARMNADAE